MQNLEYYILIEDILKNDVFDEINNIEHHGTSRMIHSKRVSYYSYKICKVLHLDYIAAARAGLLHDFFLSEKNRNRKQRFKSTFVHPKKALENSIKHFNINEKEKDIIISHMFPINIHIPKYAESWLVSLVDKIVGCYEFLESFSIKHTYVPNLYLLTILTIFRWFISSFFINKIHQSLFHTYDHSDQFSKYLLWNQESNHHNN